jgi:2-keto-3-deoxy-6-phosphogluconate aldolase
MNGTSIYEKEAAMAKYVPSYTGTLRSHSLMLPPCISDCSGIRIFGRRIKSLAFSTDVAIIKNINADAIIAVYPFTPQPVISQAIINVSDVPVFVGVGGGITTGQRSVRLAVQAEHQGAYGVVLNAPVPNEVIRQIKEDVDIPVVVTVVSAHTDIRARLEAGADFLNVSGAAATPDIVAEIRRDFPEVAIIATGGPTEESILRTIQAGANAITYTPPSNGELFEHIMERHRERH